MPAPLRIPVQCRTVTSHGRLIRAGRTPATIRANLAARRWQRVGAAIVLHTGRLSVVERLFVGLVHAGPGALLTGLSSAYVHGLRGWDRPAVHALNRAGTHGSDRCPFPVVLHRVGEWGSVRRHRVAPVHALPDALLVAAADLLEVRSACGLIAAAVQQRLVQPVELAEVLARRPRQRHRRHLSLALADIAQGAEALSEIDFARLCRRHHLPEPERQRIRYDSRGRRRYLDAEWRRRDGRRVVVEVDGAMHLEVRRWWEDQSRQNEISIQDSVVLRFPSVVVRSEEAAVAGQLRRALLR